MRGTANVGPFIFFTRYMVAKYTSDKLWFVECLLGRLVSGFFSMQKFNSRFYVYSCTIVHGYQGVKEITTATATRWKGTVTT